MKKYYEEAKYNAAFDRCVDVMTQLLQKYGHQVLDKLEQDTPQAAECSKVSTFSVSVKQSITGYLRYEGRAIL